MIHDAIVMARKKFVPRGNEAQFYRDIKQLTGIEKCQCRQQRFQRNPIACAVHVWVFLKK